jgi:hypothetical protein
MIRPAFETFIETCTKSQKKNHQYLSILLQHIPSIIEQSMNEGKFTAKIVAKHFGISDDVISNNEDLIRTYLEKNGYRTHIESKFIKEFETETELYINWGFAE